MDSYHFMLDSAFIFAKKGYKYPLYLAKDKSSKIAALIRFPRRLLLILANPSKIQKPDLNGITESFLMFAINGLDLDTKLIYERPLPNPSIRLPSNSFLYGFHLKRHLNLFV